MIRVADLEAVYDGPAGAFCWQWEGEGSDRTRVLVSKVPGGSVGTTRIRPVGKSAAAHPSWEWDGNKEKPTLSPSVHAVGHWHGWFRAGRMVST
jgi:hypothetical protein